MERGNMEKIWKKAEAVYNLLEDNLSKEIFEKKLNWLIRGGEDGTVDLMYQVYSESRILELEKVHGKNARCAIAGAGHFGELTYKALQHAGYPVEYFLDNDIQKRGTSKFGVPVISFAEFCVLNEDILVILDNMRLKDLFFHELSELGYPRAKIFVNSDDIVRSAFGNIYFDLPEMIPQEDEIFLDAGSFDGETTKEFINWCDGKYKKIYAFEPMEDGFLLTKKNLGDLENVELVKCALGICDGEVLFSQCYDGMMGSRIGTHGDKVESVQLRSIDSVLKDEKATFIKMDIEGAELDALKGAEQTLRTYKPKLAISLYHRDEDMIEIPFWLKSIVPEYKFYLRHYSNKKWDFVLYCI